MIHLLSFENAWSEHVCFSWKLFLGAQWISKIYTRIVSSFDMADENQSITPCRSFGWEICICRSEEKNILKKKFMVDYYIIFGRY